MAKASQGAQTPGLPRARNLVIWGDQRSGSQRDNPRAKDPEPQNAGRPWTCIEIQGPRTLDKRFPKYPDTQRCTQRECSEGISWRECSERPNGTPVKQPSFLFQGQGGRRGKGVSIDEDVSIRQKRGSPFSSWRGVPSTTWPSYNALNDTYDHRPRRTGHPVRSADS